MLDEIVETIKKDYSPEKIILFGSRVKGEASEDSDYDLVVLKETKEPFVDRVARVRRMVGTTTPLDIAVYTPEEFETLIVKSLFVSEAATHGEVVYSEDETK